MLGIDVSVHNGKVDFKKVKAAGYDFVFIRDGYGDVLSYPSQIDSRYEENYKNAKAAGMHVGAYHYMYATTVEAARREAQGMLSLLKGKQFDMPVALDIEERAQYNLNGMAKSMIIEAFMDVIEKAGYYAVLYSYEAFLKTVPKSTLDKYDIWCANIVSKPSIRYGIWQYSFTGKVDGIHGDVDLDRTDKDYPKLMRDGGFNGYKKPSQPVEKPILDKAGFKNGDKSLGVLALKQLLSLARDKNMTSANFDCSHDKFAAGTEKAVNDILTKWGYQPNGIAGENFIKKLAKSLEK